MKRFSTLVKRSALAAIALGLSAGIAAACPNWNNPTVFGSGTLNAGFMPDPVQVPRITAGGTQDLSRCFPGQGWFGYVVSRPDYRLFYNGTSPTGRLSFQLFSNATDTVLLVNAPDATWYFNDDSNGTFHSTVTISNPLPGQYDVWTGSYNRSSNNAAQLYITER